MSPFIVNGRSYPIDRLNYPLPSLDLLSWLASQSLYPKVFWKERDSTVTRAAVGNLLSFPDVVQLSSTFPARLYGGIRFSPSNSSDSCWKGFPKTCFWLPQIEISQEEGRTSAEVYTLKSAATLHDPLTFEPLQNALQPQTYTLLERQDNPTSDDWEKKVETALNAIASRQIDKLVLARKTTLQFASPLSAWPILAHLLQKAKHATVFAFQLSPRVCFLGATPEKLFQREGDLFNTDANASTRPRGQTPDEDREFAEQLLTSAKEQREFHIVKNFLDRALSPLSQNMQWEGADRVLKASHVQHLYNRLNAKLKGDISDADLIRALHPTPALGGFPTREALDILHQIEPFDRGWYGAPVGTIEHNSTNLYVAIRSALIEERSLHLFAGTGLVEGSIAEREWEELEQKIRPFAELFY